MLHLLARPQRTFALCLFCRSLSTTYAMTDANNNIYDTLQAIIGTDAGGRGMKSLIVEGDLHQAAEHVANLPSDAHVIVLSGFPCCVTQTPPTETDGPPGTLAIAKACAAIGCKTTVVTEDVNQAVFEAAWNQAPGISCRFFPASFTEKDHAALQDLAKTCDLLISCERSGQAKDGNYYTMRGINMNDDGRSLVGPLNNLVDMTPTLISIGDGGNELGMGKMIQNIRDKIPKGDQIGCVVPANHLIAASVSNWGGYALAAAIAVAASKNLGEDLATLLEKCVPTEQEEVDLLNRCVAAGCRDGVSGHMEATVDGMPMATSMQCLDDLRQAVLDYAKENK